jgi:hypothetical protein
LKRKLKVQQLLQGEVEQGQGQGIEQEVEKEINMKPITAKTCTKSPLLKKDACYRKAKAKYRVFPSAYASGYIAKCRKRGGNLG